MNRSFVSAFAAKCAAFCSDIHANFGVATALLIPMLLVAAGGVVDVTDAFLQKEELQQRLDAGVLAAAREADASVQKGLVLNFLTSATSVPLAVLGDDPSSRLEVTRNADGSLSGRFHTLYPTNFLGLIGKPNFTLSVASTAISQQQVPAACIYVLGNQAQAVLINSGASVSAKNCSIQVASTANPAFIMNSGAIVDSAKFCAKGTRYIKNGGVLSNLVTGCAAESDPYPQLPEPSLPQTCTTSGWLNGNVQTISPGLHCETGFNGSPTITFLPGLHIISGRMIINSNATVVANGVTFYFPNVNSEIRVNGGLKLTASAPTSGTYKGILMFEKTSNAANNSNKQQYVFNGSNGEVLEGVIHLPNRDVVYNSTTIVASKLTLIVNTIIMNSSKWQIEPFGGGGSGGAGGVRLTQ